MVMAGQVVLPGMYAGGNSLTTMLLPPRYKLLPRRLILNMVVMRADKMKVET